MILHALAAAFFGFLPSFLVAFGLSGETLWVVASSLLGLFTGGQTIMVVGLHFRANRRTALYMAVFGSAATLVLVLNVFGWVFEREFAPYLLGVGWHAWQSGILFLQLVAIPSADMRVDDD